MLKLFGQAMRVRASERYRRMRGMNGVVIGS